MDATANQQQLVSNLPVDITDATITEETALTDQQPDEGEAQQSAIPDSLEWNTSLVSEVRKYIFYFIFE
jgi:hypothetical protein